MNSASRPAALVISASFARKLWLQRHLVWNFVLRDLKARYVGSFMGFFWSVVHPLVLLVCYSFVFSVVLDVRPYGSAVDNFALFLFCGLLPWLYFQETLSRSCGCIVENGNLIRKTLFPSEILPLSLALSNLVTHLIGVSILILVLLFLGLISWTVLFVPVYLVLLFLISLGLGWLLAALQVFLRDTAQVVTVLLVFWFWFTPIFYTVELVPESFRFFFRLNPLAAIVEGYRRALLDQSTPSWSSLLLLLACGVLLFSIGGLVFRNTKREFADVL